MTRASTAHTGADRTEDIVKLAAKGLDYAAKRVVGAAYFDMTPDYAAELRRIADTPEVIDPRFEGATGILHDVATRIETIAVALRVTTVQPNPDHRFPQRERLNMLGDELHVVMRFLEHLQTRGWAISGVDEAKELIEDYFDIDLDALALEDEILATLALRSELQATNDG